MANLTWGDLLKSQTDNETIEQAIVRIVAEHNSDAESHLGETQSLQSHKAAEIIDHLAMSIVADKIKRGAIDFSKIGYDVFTGIVQFESLDMWNWEGGSRSASYGEIILSTAFGANNKSYTSLRGSDLSKIIQPNKNWLVNFGFVNRSAVDDLIYVGAGGVYEPWDVWENSFVGLRSINNQVACFWVLYDVGLDQYVEYYQNISNFSLAARS